MRGFLILSAGVRQSSGEEIAMSGVNIPIGRSDFAYIRRNQSPMNFRMRIHLIMRIGKGDYQKNESDF